MTHNKVLSALSVTELVAEFDAAQRELVDLHRQLAEHARVLAGRESYRRPGQTPVRRLAQLLDWPEGEVQALLDGNDPPFGPGCPAGGVNS